MAGKNQHFIPQFLQRGVAVSSLKNGGFSSTKKQLKKKKETQVWIFSDGKSPYRTSTRNKGAERFFYGLEDSIVDTTITDAEPKYANLVNQLRQHRSDTPVDAEEIAVAELVAHLFVRTKHTRRSGEEALGMALDMFKDLFKSPSDFENFLRNSVYKGQKTIEDSLERKIREAPLYQQRIVRKRLVENPNILAEATEKFVKEAGVSNPFTSNFFESMKGEAADTARDTHIKMLSKSIFPKERTERLKALSWFLYVRELGSFILGDAVSLCQVTNNQYRSHIGVGEEFQRILLPISSQHLLIGSVDTPSKVVNIESINQASAAVSQEFFIASQNTQKEKHYASQIGTKCSIASEDELKNIKDTIRKEWLS